MHKFLTLSVQLLCLFLVTGTASAQITVNRSVVEFTASAKVQDIEIMNNGNFKVYLDLKASEILNPESESPTRVELDDPRSAPVIVSPRQLLVPPGERKRVRVILREAATDKDRVFRLAVKPYTGKAKIDNAGGDKKASAIKVLVGYDLLLLSRPPNAKANLDVSRTNNVIEFTNDGNTNVLLRKIEQCDATAGDCVPLQPNRLYAGETYRLDLPKQGSAAEYPVKVWRSVGLDNSKGEY